jgi:transcriptional regulator with XRE-family HTH domain
MSATHKQAGSEIRRLRTDRGWTHEDMSAAIFREFGATYATSPRTIWRVESGHKPSVRKQFAIARILDSFPSQLWPESRSARRVVAA